MAKRNQRSPGKRQLANRNDDRRRRLRLEPLEQRWLLTAVAVPSTTAGEIDSHSDVETFSFEATAGTRYNLYVTEGTLAWSQLRLLDAGGAELAQGESSLDLPSGYDSYLNWIAPTDGTFTAEIQSIPLQRLGDFTFTVEVANDDHHDRHWAATPIESPAVFSGEVNFPRDVDLFSFSGVSGQVFWFEVSASFDFEVRLLNSRTQPLRVVSAAAGETTLISGFGEGMLFLRIEGGQLDDLGEYEIDFVIESDDHGDEFATSTPITFPADISGRLHSRDIDYFSFHADAGTAYDLQVSLGAGITLAVQEITESGISGELLYSTSPSGNEVTTGNRLWVPERSGVYYLKMESCCAFWAAEYSFDLEVLEPEDDHGNDADLATLVSIPSSTPASIEVVGDIDFFSFQASAGDHYTISRTLDSLPSGPVELYGTDGVTRLLPPIHTSPSVLYWSAPASGVYYVKLPGNVARDYVLSIALTEYDDDHGNSFDSATPTVIPAMIEASFEVPGDVDVFMFHGTIGEQFDFFRTSGSFSLFNSGGERLYVQSDQFAWVVPETGEYFLVVTAPDVNTFEFDAIPYSVSITHTDDDHGNTIAAATPVTLPLSLFASLHSNDYDYFSFTATAGSVYRLATELVGRSDKPAMHLYDNHAGDALVSGDGELNWMAPEDGTLFLRVTRYQFGGDYSLEISEVAYTDDHGNVPGTATEIDVPLAMNGELETLADTDVFAFTATAGLLYDVVATSGPSVNSALEIFDTDGVTSLAIYDSPDDHRDPHIRWVAPEDGTFYVSVRDNGQGFGTYAFSVENVSYADDYGNLISDATVVSVDSVIVGEIETRGDQDFFSFTAVAGAVYEIPKTSGDVRFQPTPFDDSGPLAYEDYSFSKIRWIAPSDGDFRVRVGAIHQIVGESGFDGEYSFEIRHVLYTDDHGNLPTLSTVIDVPSSTAASIEVERDYDMFSFVAEKDSEYLISTSSDGLFDEIEFRVLGVEGEVLASGRRHRPARWAAPDDGVYTVRVGNRNGVADYVLDVTVIENDDHGSLRHLATQVAVPSVTTGTLEIYPDDDLFSFRATAGTRYGFVVFNNSSSGGFLQLRDGEFSVLDSTVFQSMITWVAPEDGTYYLNVDGGSLGEYELRVQALVNGLPCDFVGGGNGCDQSDIDLLFTESDRTDLQIRQWLFDASSAENLAKGNASDFYVLGDVNLDGDVDSTDLGRLLNSFGDESGLGWSSGNLNADGNVNSADLGILLNNFGYESPASAASVAFVTPEPSTTRLPRAALPVSNRSVVVSDRVQSESTQKDTALVFESPVKIAKPTTERNLIRDLVFGSLDEDE